MGFSRQEQGIFPIQGSNLCLLHLLHWQSDCLPVHHLASHEGKVLNQWGSATEADHGKAVSLRLFSDHTLHVLTSSPSLKSDLEKKKRVIWVCISLPISPLHLEHKDTKNLNSLVPAYLSSTCFYWKCVSDILATFFSLNFLIQFLEATFHLSYLTFLFVEAYPLLRAFVLAIPLAWNVTLAWVTSF